MRFLFELTQNAFRNSASTRSIVAGYEATSTHGNPSISEDYTQRPLPVFLKEHVVEQLKDIPKNNFSERFKDSFVLVGFTVCVTNFLWEYFNAAKNIGNLDDGLSEGELLKAFLAVGDWRLAHCTVHYFYSFC